MKHFDYVEWLLYKNNTLSINKQMEMEEHLYNCDSCMEIFLSLIDEDEIERASSIVPDDFSQVVMEEISKNKVKVMDNRRTRKKYINFGYYVAVASVTILLTMGGLFNNLVDAVPKISVELQMNSSIKKSNIIYDFSEKIVNKTSKLIGSIENVEEREIRRNKDER